MQTSKPSPLPDVLLRRGLPAAIAVVESVRDEVQALARRVGPSNPQRFIDQARRLVARHEPLMARTLRDSLLLAWMKAAQDNAPPLPRAESFTLAGGPPKLPGSVTFAPTGQSPGPFAAPLPASLQPPPPPILTPSPIGPEPVIRFPQLEAAARDLAARRILTRDLYDSLDQDARRTAFTIARVASVDAIAKIRDAVSENVQHGGTLEEFQTTVRDAVGSSALSPAQTETLYRTHVGNAYATGQREILTNPLVNDHFPYVLWSATHDSRTRPEHLAMEKHGQNGTAVYRLDDPIWQYLWPPAGWNCRCHCIPLTIEAAARYGSKEATAWLRTGQPPAEPVYAARPYPITPPAGWPAHDRIQAVV